MQRLPVEPSIVVPKPRLLQNFFIGTDELWHVFHLREFSATLGDAEAGSLGRECYVLLPCPNPLQAITIGWTPFCRSDTNADYVDLLEEDATDALTFATQADLDAHE